MEKKSTVHEHLNAAKEELKNAAEVIVESTKDKAKEMVADAAESVSHAADKVHENASTEKMP